MYIKRETVAVTTAIGGTATGYSGVINGKILEVQYVKTDFANGVDFTITTETTGKTVWTEANVDASKTVMPRQATHDTAGTAVTYDGTRAVLEPIAVDNERIKIVIAAGGDAKSGTFYITIEGTAISA